MPPQSHAWRSLLPACALFCALLTGTDVLVRRGPEGEWASHGEIRSGPPRALGREAVAGESRLPPIAAGANPAGRLGPPRWTSNREVPAIPWEALHRTVVDDERALEFTFRRGGLVLRAEVAVIKKRSDFHYTLLGHFSDSGRGGSWSLTRIGAVVVANFRLPDGKTCLEWRVSPDGTPIEHEINPDLLPPCEAGVPASPVLADEAGPAMPHRDAPDATPMIPSPPPVLGDEPPPMPEVAVMVVYTPAAVAAVGGSSAMEALVYLAVDETNAALADSLAQPRLRLVHHQALAYDETVTDLSVDLARLRTPSDGYLDEVVGLRELVGADLVSMVVVNAVSCGRAYTLVSNPGAFSNYAFSVVAHDCVATNYSFSHEIAHNLGCQHAVGDDGGTVVSGQGIFPYAHGWRFRAASVDATLYRTIMAQAPGLRVPFYSSPDLLVAGTAAGSGGTADCVRTINATGPMAAQWRATPETLYGDAVEQPDWIFQSGGNAAWTVQPIVRRDGEDALQVGLVPDHGVSWLQTIREGPLQLEFFWKIAFDDPTAALAVSVDGIEYARIRNVPGWQEQQVRLAKGPHVVRWTQTRGSSGDALGTLAWIDNLRVSPVPMRVHTFETEGLPIAGVAVEFESIPFQDYVLEMTTDFLRWRPLSQLRPTDPAARSTKYHAVFPQTIPRDIPEAAAFRVRRVD